MYIVGIFVLLWIATSSEGRVNLLHIDHDYSRLSGQPEGYYLFDDDGKNPLEEIARSQRSLLFGNRNTLANNNLLGRLFNCNQGGCTKCCPPEDASQSGQLQKNTNENVNVMPSLIPQLPGLSNIFGRPSTIPQLPCLPVPGYSSLSPKFSPGKQQQQQLPYQPQNQVPPQSSGQPIYPQAPVPKPSPQLPQSLTSDEPKNSPQAPPAEQPQLLPQLPVPPPQKSLPVDFLPMFPPVTFPPIPSVLNIFPLPDSPTNLRPEPQQQPKPEQFTLPAAGNEASKNLEIDIIHENREKSLPNIFQPVIYVQPSYVISPQDLVYPVPSAPSVPRFYEPPTLPQPSPAAENYNNLRNWCIQNFSGGSEVNNLPPLNIDLSEMYSSESRPMSVTSDFQPFKDCSAILQDYNNEMETQADNAPRY